MEEMRNGGPAAMEKYADDKEFMELVTKIQAKIAKVAAVLPRCRALAPCLCAHKHTQAPPCCPHGCCGWGRPGACDRKRRLSKH